MPLFYQQDINENTKLGIWLIRESESFFLHKVPIQRTITHPHKRLQHLAGRYLLKYLFADFPYELIRIADTRKPFLQNEAYHFSISHCADFAAALVSKTKRVGVDVEIATPKVGKILHKFLNEREREFLFSLQSEIGNPRLRDAVGQGQSAKATAESENDWRPATGDWRLPTLLWSAKESVFKWYGNGGIDFSDHIILESFFFEEQGVINCIFSHLLQAELQINYKLFDSLSLSWVTSDHTG